MSDEYEEYREFIDSFSKMIDPDDQVRNMQKNSNQTNLLTNFLSTASN